MIDALPHGKELFPGISAAKALTKLRLMLGTLDVEKCEENQETSQESGRLDKESALGGHDCVVILKMRLKCHDAETWTDVTAE